MALDSGTSNFHANKYIFTDICARKELYRVIQTLIGWTGLGWGELQRGGGYDLIREIRISFLRK